MKAIMISDKPKWCALMMNGDKIVEVRTSKALASAIQKLIDENEYADIYVYCSKDEKIKLVHSIGYYYVDKRKVGKLAENNLNGKVVFKFRCYKVVEWNYYSWQEIMQKSCMSVDELLYYSVGHKSLFLLYIDNLVIFDEPKELDEFYKAGFDKELKESLKSEPYPICSVRIGKQYQLTKAPQNFCYVEVD